MNLRSLFEAVPISLVRPYLKAERMANYDDLFQSLKKWARDDKAQRLYFPLKTKAVYVSERFPLARDVVETLKTYVCSILVAEFVEYVPSVASHISIGLFSSLEVPETETELKAYCDGLVSGFRNAKHAWVRIGKLYEAAIKLYRNMKEWVRTTPRPAWLPMGRAEFMTMCDRVIDALAGQYEAFRNDSARKASEHEYGFYMVVSRHPYDIATASTNRGWTSCLNMTDGSEREYVLSYVKNGHLIAYLIREGDWNIKNPISRIMLMRYNNEDNMNDFIFMPGDAYGTDSPRFANKVLAFCRLLNKGKDDGIYCSQRDDQYVVGQEINKGKAVREVPIRNRP